MAYAVSVPNASGIRVIEETIEGALAFAATILAEGDSALIETVDMRCDQVHSLPECEGF